MGSPVSQWARRSHSGLAGLTVGSPRRTRPPAVPVDAAGQPVVALGLPACLPLLISCGASFGRAAVPSLELVTMKPAGVQDAGIDLKFLTRIQKSFDEQASQGSF